MSSTDPILDYQSPDRESVGNRVWRFQLIYAIGISAAYIGIAICCAMWPHTSDSRDLTKAELALDIRIIGAAAAVWLVLGLLWIARNGLERQSFITWLLVAVNAVVAFAVFPVGYQ